MIQKLEYSLVAVNERLAIARFPVRLMLRGDRIWVKGTFPAKPGGKHPHAHQQRISLGLSASEAGFRQAEKEARLIGSELASKEFRWDKYLSPNRLPETKPCRLWVREFQGHYLSRNDLQPTTWKRDWLNIYKRLPQDSPLTADTVQAIIMATATNTRDRLETCRKLQALMDFAKLDANFLDLKGNYGPSKVVDRDVPSDQAIAEQRDMITHPGWQWVYGIMAACGLRDHEAFFCEWTPEGLQVLKGKTGPRLIFQPLYPQWVERWDLRTIIRPPIQDPDHQYEQQQLGTKVSRAFKRQGVPFTPYTLRHAFGIRASVTFELPVTTAAALMGHSPKVHLERYHKHIQLKTNQAAAARVMARVDLPPAP
jgi:integrase